MKLNNFIFRSIWWKNKTFKNYFDGKEYCIIVTYKRLKIYKLFSAYAYFYYSQIIDLLSKYMLNNFYLFESIDIKCNPSSFITYWADKIWYLSWMLFNFIKITFIFILFIGFLSNATTISYFQISYIKLWKLISKQF